MTSDNAMPQPANPEFRSAVRESFQRQGLMKLLGAWLETVEPGRVAIEVPFSDRLSQQHGTFHGGVCGTIADTAGGYAALSLMPPDSEVVTVEYKINFIRPAAGDAVLASAQIVRHGRSLSVARIDVATRCAGEQSVVAIVQATYMRAAPATRTG